MWEIKHKSFTDEVLVCTRLLNKKQRHLCANALTRRSTLFLAEQKCRTNVRCDFNSWTHCALKKAAAYTTPEKMLHTQPGERCTTHSPGKKMLHTLPRESCCNQCSGRNAAHKTLGKDCASNTNFWSRNNFV